MTTKYTVREQARKPLKRMRCSELLRKPAEISRNEISAHEDGLASNRLWQAGGKARFIYLPPGLRVAQDKPLLIDLEAAA